MTYQERLRIDIQLFVYEPAMDIQQIGPHDHQLYVSEWYFVPSEEFHNPIETVFNNHNQIFNNKKYKFKIKNNYRFIIDASPQNILL